MIIDLFENDVFLFTVIIFILAFTFLIVIFFGKDPLKEILEAFEKVLAKIEKASLGLGGVKITTRNDNDDA